MISEHERLQDSRRAMREQIPYSTDPQRLREMAGIHQYSKTFTVCIWAIGFFAAWGIFMAVASI